GRNPDYCLAKNRAFSLNVFLLQKKQAGLHLSLVWSHELNDVPDQIRSPGSPHQEPTLIFSPFVESPLCSSIPHILFYLMSYMAVSQVSTTFRNCDRLVKTIIDTRN